MAGGCRAHAGSRRQHRHARRVLVGVRRDRRRRVGLGLVRSRRRAARRCRDRHRHGHPHRRATDVAAPGAPRDHPRRPPRHPLPSRRPARLVREPSGLASLLDAHRRATRRALRHPPGRADVARGQRTRRRKPPVLLRRVVARVPRVDARALRHDRRAQPGVGHRGVGAALPQLRRRDRAARQRVGSEPVAAPRVRPVQLRRAPRPVPARARRAPAGRRRDAHHDESHGGRRRQRRGLRRLGR